MTARGYELDSALGNLTTRVKRLELKEARNRPAGGLSFTDDGGFFGGGVLTIQDVLNLIGAGSAPGSFLTVVGGGKGTVQAHGTLGATETIDVGLANYHWGTLDQACTVTFTGWTTLKDCQIAIEVLEDGTGGWTPTFTGVTWLGGTTPTHATTASTSTIYVFLSRDGGTTIYGAQAGSGSAGGFLSVINGGGGTVQAHGNLGATETIDTLNGNYHWGTLNASVTLTFVTTADTAERWFTFEAIQDGTGGRVITWPGSVTWIGGMAPTQVTTAGTTTIYSFFTRNGGTTWIGGQLGASTGLTVENEGTPLATAGTTLDFVGPLVAASGTGIEKTITITGALDDLTDVTLTTPAIANRLRFDGFVWRNSALIWRPVTVFDPTSGLWVPLVDGSGNAIMAEA